MILKITEIVLVVLSHPTFITLSKCRNKFKSLVQSSTAKGNDRVYDA